MNWPLDHREEWQTIRADPCARCMDGACAYCLGGFPGQPLDCGCHVEREEPAGPCPSCGSSTSRYVVETPVAGTVETVVGCDAETCGWEDVTVGSTP